LASSREAMGLSDASYNTLVASVFAATAFAGIVLYIRRVWSAFQGSRRQAWPGSLRKVVERCASLPLRVLALVAYEEDDGDGRVAAHVCKEVARQRAAYAKAFASGANVLMIGVAMGHAYLAFARRHGNRTNDVWQDWAIVIATILILSIDAQPCLQKQQVAKVSHCAFMALLLFYMLPCSGSRVADFYSWSHSISILSRLMLGLMHLDIRVSFWSNVAFTLIIEGCVRIVDPSRQASYFAINLVVGLAVIITLLYSEVSLISSARQSFKERSSTSQRLAVTALLSMVCDAVVELDDQLGMMGDCPALTNLLFRSQAKGLLGQSLKEFVVGDDQKLFDETMACEGRSSEEATRMVHIRLRDSWGNTVPMELFHVPFCGADDELRHLVGLREHGDVQAALPETGDGIGESLPSSQVLGGRITPLGHGALPAASGAGLQVDVFAVEPLKITFASPKFKKKYGSVDTFEECLPKPEEFRQWVMTTADAVWSGFQSPQVYDFGALVVGREKEQLRLVQALFVAPQELDGPKDRSTYRVSIRLGGCLSSAGSDSSISTSSRIHGTSPTCERLSFGPAQHDHLQARLAHPMEAGGLPLELAQTDLASQCIVSM